MVSPSECSVYIICNKDFGVVSNFKDYIKGENIENNNKYNS